ncbi:hypothetical protein EMIHUDRAFT_245118 [Emiliania huxleyi CCMP1516]|uniref:PDZ domain-containing protein n=2 Tax=Emiliania huxleyi TaxID=2903 RepID=A0A0D3IYW0_EMIH1|nr:hypothetical protein EMIHUDRAFT_245118 [Emiliania huxleyi CCMP1516]EOD16445.1 hypothetical protein EMIHUDRAFT_245118 [Emiliania huxleyi CCMP1516]|eukprot:XP_005768874.1 hypothetical protein EMIHUDRAFT_245118 [Emiliania huxleyi CCMP1516]
MPTGQQLALSGAALAALTAWTVRLRQEKGWEETLERVAKGVVVVRVNSVMAFDMNERGFSLATGFVVDKALGIILTNRHVVTTGPVTADAVLHNKEEIELTPLYADPVHDFGFFKYDPADVRFMELQEIPLAPSEARVRVVGNDAGEKISILSGTIARLDRAAPNYGSHTYNDFNTFYFSCASNTSGGSSGSPVVNASGRAVALNAGTSTKSASSYYLPLQRPARALALLQKALLAGRGAGRACVPRGTLGVVLQHRAFGELKRLGLRRETEARLRLSVGATWRDTAWTCPGRRETEAAVRGSLPGETGMLVVDQIVPAGPAEGALEPGNCVLEPGDVLLAASGSDPAGGAPLNGSRSSTRGEAELLDERPGEAVWLTLQRGGVEKAREDAARNWNMPPGGVHVAFSGYMLSNANVPSRAVISELNNCKTPDLDAFTSVFLSLPHGARVPVRYRLPYSHHTERLAVLDVRAVTPSLVRVLFDIPYQIDGVAGLKYAGMGVVVDAAVGLVLVDRNTVPVALGACRTRSACRIEFASTVEVPAVTAFLHPTHNIALVRYDPALLCGDSVRSATLSPTPLEVGEECMFVGLPRQDAALPVFQQSVVRETCVGIASVPRFRAVNEEVIRFDDTVGGVFVDESGEVKAFWGAYCCCHEDELYEQFEGVPAQPLLPILAACSELRPVSLSVACGSVAGSGLGLSRAWAERLVACEQEKRQVLSVQRLIPGTPAHGQLLEGDLILAVDGVPVNTYPAVEAAVLRSPRVQLTVLRDGGERAVRSDGTTHITVWCGLILQHAYRAVLERGYSPPGGGVYISYYLYGSPAQKYKLVPKNWIVELNGSPVADLAGFVELVRELPHGANVRVKLVDLNGKTSAFSLKTDHNYWRGYAVHLAGEQWVLRALNEPPAAS